MEAHVVAGEGHLAVLDAVLEGLMEMRHAVTRKDRGITDDGVGTIGGDVGIANGQRSVVGSKPAEDSVGGIGLVVELEQTVLERPENELVANIGLGNGAHGARTVGSKGLDTL